MTWIQGQRVGWQEKFASRRDGTSSQEIESNGQSTRLDKLTLCIVGVMYIAAIFSVLPFTTNDGPIHISFSSYLSHANESNWQLQNAVYELNDAFVPNLVVYYLARTLFHLVSPSWAEGMIQIACLVGPAVAGYFTLSQINKRNTWWAIFLLPLALNQMFFLGLYNYSLSISLYFVVIGLFLRMEKNPTFLRASLTAGTLILTFFSHASGFLIAGLSIGVISTFNIIMDLFKRINIRHVLWKRRFDFFILLSPVPVGIAYVTSRAISAKAQYGWALTERSLIERAIYITKLGLLHVNMHYTYVVAVIVSSVILGGILLVFLKLILGHSNLSKTQQFSLWGMLLTFAMTILVALTFPDTLGGGWAHFRRMVIFPFCAGILCLGFITLDGRSKLALLCIGVIASISLLGSAAYRQSQIYQQLTPLHEIDKLIEEHRTVLPIVIDPQLMDADDSPIYLGYEPFFQVASRLELSGDRVVLFNYQARMTVYPVKFSPETNPHKLIFHWEQGTHRTDIDTIDISRFERSSGLQVDYIIIWGKIRKRPLLAEQITTTLKYYELIYESTDQRVKLYRRTKQHVLTNHTT